MSEQSEQAIFYREKTVIGIRTGDTSNRKAYIYSSSRTASERCKLLAGDPESINARLNGSELKSGTGNHMPILIDIQTLAGIVVLDSAPGTALSFRLEAGKIFNSF